MQYRFSISNNNIEIDLLIEQIIFKPITVHVNSFVEHLTNIILLTLYGHNNSITLINKASIVH